MSAGKVIFRKTAIGLLIYIGIVNVLVTVCTVLDLIEFGSYQPSLSKSILVAVLAISIYDNMNLNIEVKQVNQSE